VSGETILVIDDEPQIRRVMRSTLSAHGYVITEAMTGEEGVESARKDRPDLVLLDMNMPGMGGLEACKEIRRSTDAPIIMLTVRNAERDKVMALDAGADDYVVKPYSAEQLDARIRAVLRRSGGTETGGSIEVGGLQIDRASHEARLDGELLDLTPKEFELLLYLATNQGQVVSKRQLLADLWRQPYGGADKTIDVHLSWLRRKLGETAAEPRYLHTIRGVGVKLVEPGA
jgi:two-component system, OmpR family, KDP operon response regulator KdpE